MSWPGFMMVLGGAVDGAALVSQAFGGDRRAGL
jgi:hypothetical protein